MSIAEARPAATVVLLRDSPAGPETLLLLRSRKLGFHGGEWVFPGGRVDPEDAGEHAIDSEEAARRAAAREAREEAGVDVDPASLVSIAHWTTPVILPKRFATHFFLAPLDSGDITVDGGEIEDHRWIRPSDALRLRDAGELGLPPPTFVTLSEIALYERVDAILETFRARDTPVLLPAVTMQGEVIINLLPGDVGYADRRSDIPGRRHRVVMDPAGWRFERD